MLLVLRSLSMQLSVVDHRGPETRELALLTVRKVDLHFSSNAGRDARFVQCRLSVESVQLDDMDPMTDCPVVISHHADDTSGNFLQFMWVSDMTPSQGRLYLPYMSLITSQKVRLAVSETLIWQLFGFYYSLDFGAKEDDIGGEALGTVQDGSGPVARDLMLQIGTLELGDASLVLTFRAKPQARLRDMSRFLQVFNVVSTDRIPVQLPGFALEDVSMRYSVLFRKLQAAMMAQVYDILWNVLRRQVSLKTPIKMLGTLGKAVNVLSGDSDKPQVRVGMGEGRRLGLSMWVLSCGWVLSKGRSFMSLATRQHRQPIYTAR